MKKWLRRTLIATLLVGLTLAALYEAATHVGRGWLRGEAFYEGRPTSWWAGRIDEWMERFDTTENAVDSINWVEIGPLSEARQSDVLESFLMPASPKPRPNTWTRRFFDTFRSEHDRDLDDDAPPKVLWGWYGAEAVLSALADDPKHEPFAKHGLKNVELVRRINAAGGQPTLSFFGRRETF